MYDTLTLLAVFVLCYSVVAGVVERTWISGPIVFTLFGLLIGPVGLDLLSLQADREMIKAMAEVALALVLFTDAASADISVLKKTSGLPARLLLVGLPLTILLGFGVAALLFDNLSLFGMALLATMLAPTDAALGKAVVTNEVVPNPIRQGLNVESGLNDGICVPILFVFMALALDKAGDQGPWMLAVQLVIEEICIGLAVGVTLAFLTAKLLRLALRKQWLTRTWMQIPVIALALSCFAGAQLLGGSGFIAAFSGGIVLGIMDEHLSRTVKDELLLASEGTGDTLALVTWVIFGSAVVGQAIGGFSWMILIYSVLSLTVIRMLPVFLSLLGSGVDFEGKLFIGWFGPRGLASIVFAVLVLNSGLADGQALAMTVVCTIVLSIVGHGVTANPWARAYGQRKRQSGV
jgi:NhaP-type Na+/H+ or K+/H+ antiporter